MAWPTISSPYSGAPTASGTPSAITTGSFERKVGTTFLAVGYQLGGAASGDPTFSAGTWTKVASATTAIYGYVYLFQCTAGAGTSTVTITCAGSDVMASNVSIVAVIEADGANSTVVQSKTVGGWLSEPCTITFDSSIGGSNTGIAVFANGMSGGGLDDPAPSNGWTELVEVDNSGNTLMVQYEASSGDATAACTDLQAGSAGWMLGIGFELQAAASGITVLRRRRSN